jgi:hypothetical protein
MITLARRSLLGGRSEAGVKVNTTQSNQLEVIQERSSIKKLMMRRGQTSKESYSQLEEEGGCLEVRQESLCHHRHQKRSGYRQDLLNLRRCQYPQPFSSLPVHAMAMEQQKSILP